MENMPPDTNYVQSDSNARHRRQPLQLMSSPNKRQPSPIRSIQQNVFSTGFFTPESSQALHEMDAAKTLISPPPEDSLRSIGSRHSVRLIHVISPSVSLTQGICYQVNRYSSEPVFEQDTQHDLPALPAFPNSSPTSGSGKRKRLNLAIPDSATIADVQLTDTTPNSAVEQTPNPKARKQTRIHPRSNDHVSPTRPDSRSPSKRSYRSGSQDLLTHSRITMQPLSEHPSPVLRGLPINADDVITTHDLPRPLSHSRARSSTPVPTYEYPKDRFTPPREIILTPISARPPCPNVPKSSKRKSVGKKVFKLQVKQEPPDIDLSKPAPPPSPTDDPILLHGRAATKKANQKELLEENTSSRDTPMLESSPEVPDERNFPSPAFEFNQSLDFSVEQDSEDDELPAPEPILDFSTGGDGDGELSSDEDGEDQMDGIEEEGQYTGRYTIMTVPTKMDPPTTTTKSRMEAWGRPISPFPGKKVGRRVSFADDVREVEENQDIHPILNGEWEEEREATTELNAVECDEFADVSQDDAHVLEGSVCIDLFNCLTVSKVLTALIRTPRLTMTIDKATHRRFIRSMTMTLHRRNGGLSSKVIFKMKTCQRRTLLPNDGMAIMS